MTIIDRALELLQEIYNLAEKHNQPYQISREQYRKLSCNQRTVLEGDLDYLEGKGYIRTYTPCVGAPLSYQITPEGIDKIEGITSSKNSNIIINGEVNGIVGFNVMNNTINKGISAVDFRNLLEATVSNKQELEEIKAVIEPFLQRIEIGAPVEKGMLKSISSHLEKYQSLYAGVGQILMTFLCSK